MDIVERLRDAEARIYTDGPGVALNAIAEAIGAIEDLRLAVKYEADLAQQALDEMKNFREIGDGYRDRCYELHRERQMLLAEIASLRKAAQVPASE